MNPAALVAIFVRHRNAANLLMAILLIAGVFSLSRLNVQFFPTTGLDYVSIGVGWPGASAEDVDSNIVAAIEPAVRVLDGVQSVDSYSSEGSARVMIEYETGADMASARSQVDAAVNALRTLPEDANDPVIRRVLRYDSISRIIVTGDVSERQLKVVAKRVRNELLARGLDKVDMFGFRNDEISVSVEPSALRRLDMTIGQIAGRIRDSLTDLPSGDIRGATQKQIRSLGEPQSAEGVGAVELRATPNGQAILVRDVADVREDVDEDQPTARSNGRPAIELAIKRAESTDALVAAKTVSDYMAEITPTMPPNIRLIQYDVQAALISERIRTLLRNGVSGLVLVLLVLFVFLSLRVAFWVAMGIPVSILAAAGVMLATGQSINMVSLFAMIMTLGIIVDDAIVVGEHSATLRQRGLSPLEAAERGALTMLAPVTAAALTTIAAFMPLFMIGDIIGQIIIAIPLVVVAVLVASLIECFLILPGHLREAMHGDDDRDTRMRRFRNRFDAGFARFRGGKFRRMVVAALTYRYVTIAATLAVLLISMGLLLGGRINFVFFPNVESEALFGDIEMASGTPKKQVLAATDEMIAALRRAENKLTDGEGGLVEIIFDRAGRNSWRAAEVVAGDNLGGVKAQLSPADDRNIRTADVLKAWRAEMPDIAGMRRYVLEERKAGPPGREIDIRFRGGDTARMKQAAADLKEELGRFAGVSDVKDDLPSGKRELVLEITPHGAALGFTNDNVARQVRNAFEGAIARRFARREEEVAVRVLVDRASVSEDTIRSFYVRSPSGAETPLEEVVSFRESTGFARIRRSDGEREVAVTGEINEAVTNSGKVIAALQQGALPAIARKHGVDYLIAGKAKEQAKTLGDMQIGATIGLSAIYIILAWVFASYTRPLVVMSIIPFGLIGAIWGHMLLGFDLSILSLVALIGLAGVLVNNSIILVAAVEHREGKGEAPMAAIVGGACDRLRPVALTSFTTIAGLTPLLFETSTQAQFLIPMAITLVFGMGTASALVLLLVPAILGVQEDLGASRRRFLRWYREEDRAITGPQGRDIATSGSD